MAKFIQTINNNIKELEQRARRLRKEADRLSQDPYAQDACKRIFGGWHYPGGCFVCKATDAAKTAELKLKKAQDECKRI